MPTGTPHPQGRVSLRDVAAAVGVSHVAVSLALRDDPRISIGRRAEIRAAAEKLGYRPDPMLASLAAYRQTRRPTAIRSTVAWFNQWQNPRDLRRLQEFDAYWRGANDYAAALGYRIEEFILPPELTAARVQQILVSRNVRGILLPPHSGGFNLPEFDWSQFSVVRFGASIKEPRAHIVTCDQKNCAGTAFEQMWARGYRRIAYATEHVFDLNTGGNFRAGYLSAQDRRVPLRRHFAPLLLSENSTPADLRTLKRLLRDGKVDAFLTTLRNFRRLLRAAGVRVPDDVGVATLSLLDGEFDAGVDQNSYEIGRVAMATLAGLVQQNERGVPKFCRRILVEGQWVDGTSLPTRAVRGD